MGNCCSSANPHGVSAPGNKAVKGKQPMSEEELKQILLKRQVELSSKARPLLECSTFLKDDMQAVADAADIGGHTEVIDELGRSSRASSTVGGSGCCDCPVTPPNVTSKQQLYKLAKAEAQQDWMIFDDLPDLTPVDMRKLIVFKDLVMDSLPRLLDQGKIHDIGIDLLTRTDLTRANTTNNSGTATPAENEIGLPPKPPGPILAASSGNSTTSNEDEDEGVISFQRQNSKFLDIRSTVTAKFGSLDNIPVTPGIPVSDTIQAPRFVSDTKAELGMGIQAVRQNSLERLTDLSKLKFVNNSAVVGVNSSSINGLDDIISTPHSASGKHMKSPKHTKRKDDYDVPKGPFREKYAIEIYETYKRGGRVSKDTIHKVLRNAYRSLKNLPNTTKITVASCEDPENEIEPRERLTIVGDIHGQLYDLIHILDESGLPSATNKYIFNGDFVDRGTSGVEVMVILMAFHAVFPESVCLNRGNHEDYAICCVYGFSDECCSKYDEITFGMFVEVFQYLPLFAVVNDAILVVHGGLFHSSKICLEDLSDINRSDFSLKDLPQSGESLDPIPRENKREFLKQLQRDALWSDPTNEDTGISQSSRGAGVMFGMDIADRFLKDNNLSMIFRSHECVQHGFEFPYAQARGYAKVKSVDPGILCTVFSASNYGGHSDNSGAYIVLVAGADAVESADSVVKPVHKASVPNHPELKYTAYQYSITDDIREKMKSSFTTSSWSIYNIVRDKHGDLLSSFKVLDHAEHYPEGFEATSAAVAAVTGDQGDIINPNPTTVTVPPQPEPSGWITFCQWSDVMHHVTKIDLRWMSMIPVVVPDQFIRRSSKDINEHVIDYSGFLDHYKEGGRSGIGGAIDEIRDVVPEGNKTVIETLYIHHKQLEIIFNFFDEDGDGQISRPQFMEKCKLINEVDEVDENDSNIIVPISAATAVADSTSTKRDLALEPTADETDEQLPHSLACQLFALLDLDDDGYIDVNEFFEIYRVIDVKTSKPKKELNSNDRNPSPLLEEEEDAEDDEVSAAATAAVNDVEAETETETEVSGENA